MAESLLNQEKFADLLAFSDELTKRAAAREASDAARQEQIQNAIPAVVDELVKYACVDEVQRGQVTNILQDQLETLKFIKKLASKVLAPEPMGEPADPQTKRASDGSANRFQHDVLKSPAAAELLQKARTWGTVQN